MFVFIAIAMMLLWVNNPLRLAALAVHGLQLGSAIFYFLGAINMVQYKVYDSQIATLKEIKQLQLQILELQASLAKKE